MAFSVEFLSQQKDRLRSERERLEGELSRIARKAPRVADDYEATFPEIGRGEDENALEEEAYASRRSIEQELEVHLREVRQALERLEAGTYGACGACGAPISEGRLVAFPAATACITHAPGHPGRD